EGIDPLVARAIRDSIDRLGELGATIDETSLPTTKYALAAYYVVAPAEASANLARFDGVKYGLRIDGADYWTMLARTRDAGFGPEVKRRIMTGTYTLSAGYYDAYYLQAQKARTLITRDFERVFQRFDVLAVPTAPTTAFPIGARIDDPV